VLSRLPVPTGIHWHGLLLPNGMDGVPFVTPNPIQPGCATRGRTPATGNRSRWSKRGSTPPSAPDGRPRLAAATTSGVTRRGWRRLGTECCGWP
jgi:hypothetical protein